MATQVIPDLEGMVAGVPGLLAQQPGLLTGLRAGVVTFFDELGPDNVFVYKTSGDPNSTFAPPKERKRRAIKKEYADVIQRYATSVQEITLAMFIPPATNGPAVPPTTA